MTTMNELKILVEDIHSTVVATLDRDGRPVTRVIDMMLYDENGLYFLTAKGKEFYDQLQDQKYISLSAIKDKRSVSLKGKVRNIGKDKLDGMFEKNTCMKDIYPGNTREALDVFQLYEASGEFFDISDPAHVTRGPVTIGEGETLSAGYEVTDGCIGCRACLAVCPQECIDLSLAHAVIDQNRCLHCGRCVEACPVNAIVKRTVV